MGTVVPAAVLNCVGIGRSMEIVPFQLFLCEIFYGGGYNI